MYFETVDWATSNPSIKSSPWIRDAPHSGFSPLTRRAVQLKELVILKAESFDELGRNILLDRAAIRTTTHAGSQERHDPRLATRCEDVYGPARDIEWAFAEGTLYLLQCRAITRSAS
jgi:hypothetical protein